jgi:hypothetical protein
LNVNQVKTLRSLFSFFVAEAWKWGQGHQEQEKVPLMVDTVLKENPKLQTRSCGVNKSGAA